jgi:antitoxin component YwqK of YwqJK toxin-antitoxin module
MTSIKNPLLNNQNLKLNIKNMIDVSKDGYSLIYQLNNNIKQATIIKKNVSKLSFSYVDGIPSGNALEKIYKNGVVEHITEFTFVNGIRDGSATRIFSDGKCLNFIYFNGKEIYP